ncbi:hypothetical protein C4580_02685 [Candidatus Woesearchaeota archaeon]|nr:MAG: hypothetical protein C4580_02685 [Candidatus Woesearchaeota archaeon]
MQIPHTAKREHIERLFRKKDWAGLAEFEIHIIDAASPLTDCGHYVLASLGLEGTVPLIEAIQRIPRTPSRATGIVVYSERGDIRHFGRYDHTTGKVRSKWNFGPVLEHALDAVPSCYGTFAEFCTLQRAQEYFHERRQTSLFGPEYY